MIRTGDRDKLDGKDRKDKRREMRHILSCTKLKGKQTGIYR